MITAGSKGTILLLCSDFDVLSVLRGALTDAGYTVLFATNLGLAVARLDECKPDLLILRPYLEDISGHEAARYLRTRCNGLRAPMVAGMPMDDRVVYREAIRDVEIFPKPFTVAEFLEKVAAILSPSRKK